MLDNEKQSFTKPVGQWLISKVLAVAILLTTGFAILIYKHTLLPSMSQTPVPVPPKSEPVIKEDIGALGRIEPKGEVLHLSASTSIEGARVEQLLVKKGDKVRAGQVIAILDNNARRLAALEQAQKEVQLPQARLAQVKAGAKTGEITAQRAKIAGLEAELRGEIATQEATIARLDAELRNSQAENRRYQQLYQDGAISVSELDSKRLKAETVQQQLNEAKATLNRNVNAIRDQLSETKATLESITEIRPTDVKLAQAEVNIAKAAVKRAQAELNLTYVRAPIDSQILKIHTLPGEIISSAGIAELGQTNEMYVVAQVYETDIKKVRVGQLATINSAVVSGKIQGKVTDIGLQVERQNIFNVEPTADTDHKVVEVKIRLNNSANSQQVASLTNLQVQVVIHIQQ